VKGLQDSLTLSNPSLWHASYYDGYKAFFSTLDQWLDLDIPDKTVEHAF